MSNFSLEKQKLFQTLLKNKGINTLGTQTISSKTETGSCKLSFAQERLWFLTQLEPESPLYNIPVAVRLQGQLNLRALRQSFNEIFSRHEALRTNFQTVEGQPIAVISSVTPLLLPVVDIKELPSDQQQAEVRQLAYKEAQQLFDLNSDLLLRVKLLRLSKEEHIVLLTMHHIVSDAWSIGVLVGELATLYQAFCNDLTSPLPDLPIQYPDFAAWQRQWLQGEILNAQLSYWRKQLEGVPILELPTDRVRPAVVTFRGAVYSFELSQELSIALNKLGQQEKCTLFMTLLAAFKTLLFRYTGSEDIVVGSPIANRNRAEIEGLIGFFVNTLVLRTHLAGNPTFKELLTRVREIALGAYAHQDLPFEQLVEKLQPQRDSSHTPLFQVMFSLQNAPTSALELPGLTLSPIASETSNVKFDLTLSMTQTAQGLVGTLEYNTDLLEKSFICRMAGHFQTLLSGIVANPQQRLSQLPLLTESELYQLLIEWNYTEVEYLQQQCIHELFEAQVERTPDAIAVVFENKLLTYQKLNERANQLAHYLQTLGVQPEVLVGICLERSSLMVIGLLAILKAGGAYVPLDPAYPQERLAFMLKDSNAKVLLTQTHLVELFGKPNVSVVCIDRDSQLFSQQSIENLSNEVKPNHLAYVIYTSGSTGIPKGVAINHQSCVALLTWSRKVFTDNDLAGVLASTSICFDLSVFELFVPLSWGGTVILVENALHLPSLAAEVSLINTVPSIIAELLQVDGLPPSVRTVNLAGEPLQNQLVQQIYQNDHIQKVLNLYGPSEDTTYSTFAQVNKGDNRVTIGRPIANTQIYLLDTELQPVPIGVPGEIYIGGVGVGRGYLNRPDLTAEKFIPNPFSKQTARLYKTGDKGRYLPSGEIKYIGRIDHQAKIRGFRIEVGEIEALIAQHPGVRKTVVVVREDELGSKRLVAYTVLHPEQTLTIGKLRCFLEKKLPNYMVPSAFVRLEALPLTPNGKINHQMLPAPDLTQIQSEFNFVAPSTPVEEILAGIWIDVLNVQKVGIYDNFFELGGHSLLATRIISLVRQVFEIELPLRRLFEEPTVAKLAKDIETATKVALKPEIPPIEHISRNEELPLSFAQQRLWFLAQLEPESPFYNLPYAIHLQGQLNITALQQSFNEILRRHEALRTNFQIVKGRPVAVILSVTALLLPIIDLSELPPTSQEGEIRQLALTDVQQHFDLKNDRLLRVKLLRLEQQEYVVLFSMHHLVSDGWSIGVLIKELTTLYKAFSNDKPSPLPDLPIQYIDFTVWQHQWLQGKVLEAQLSYWQQQLAGASVLQLPTDRPRPAVQSFRGAMQSFCLSADLIEALKVLSRQEGVTLFMTLLAAFQTLLHRYSGQDDIVVGSPIANRNRGEIEGLIGCFTNMLVLRTDMSGNPSFRQLLNRVREVALGAYAHQDLPFEAIVETLHTERNLSHNPLFQVTLTFQNIVMEELQLSNLTLKPLELQRLSTKFDLSMILEEIELELIGILEYNTDLFDAGTISRILEHFKTLLESIVADSEKCLSDLPLISEVELHQLDEWSNTERQ